MNLAYMLESIDPRLNKNEVLQVIARFLDNCDPDDRPWITCSRERTDSDDLRALRTGAERVIQGLPE